MLPPRCDVSVCERLPAPLGGSVAFVRIGKLAGTSYDATVKDDDMKKKATARKDAQHEYGTHSGRLG